MPTNSLVIIMLTNRNDNWLRTFGKGHIDSPTAFPSAFPPAFSAHAFSARFNQPLAWWWLAYCVHLPTSFAIKNSQKYPIVYAHKLAQENGGKWADSVCVCVCVCGWGAVMLFKGATFPWLRYLFIMIPCHWYDDEVDAPASRFSFSFRNTHYYPSLLAISHTFHAHLPRKSKSRKSISPANPLN